ncbi:hypothetical protein BH09BAC5_BH09BAC5_02080 [soil metagenome]
MKVRSRFAYFRDKFQVFLLGLLFGLVLGGGFFVLKLDSYVKELSFYKSLTQKEDKAEVPVIDEKESPDKPIVKKVKKNTASTDNSVTDDRSEQSSGDTALPVVYSGTNNSGEIVIRKDEQLGSKNYSVQILDIKKTDSTNLKEIVPQQNLAVEFWKSPLNYHGYKYNRNKLILFGYGDQDLVSVSKIDNMLILKCLTGIFRIEPNTEFRQLERVTDENTLSKIQ